MKKILFISFLLVLATLFLILVAVPAVDKLWSQREDSTDHSGIAQNVAITPPTPHIIPSTSPSPIPRQDQKSSVMLSFAGDILLDDHVASLIDQRGSAFVLSEIKPVFSSSDLVAANLENPISNRGEKENDKQYTFRAKPESVKVLTDGNINMLALANNHILDYGPEALLDTLNILKANNIQYAGAGEDAEAANSPVFVEKKGTRMAFIASSHVIPFVSWHAGVKKPGVASTYDPARILSEIAKAREKADIVVVYIHWGEEMNPRPVPYQKNLAKMYIDKGADIVIGSHPHILQGIEFHKGKVIAYSLGNFIFTNMKRDTMILNVEVTDKKLSQIKIIPCEINNFRPVILKNQDADRVFKLIKDLSFNIDVDAQGVVTDSKKP